MLFHVLSRYCHASLTFVVEEGVMPKGFLVVFETIAQTFGCGPSAQISFKTPSNAKCTWWNVSTAPTEHMMICALRFHFFHPTV